MARTQEKFQRRLATQARSKRERFIEHLRQAMAAHASDRTTAFSREDLVQMMEGFASVMSEALQGRSNEVRTYYVEAMVPGMVRSGLAASCLPELMKSWAMMAQQELQKDLDGAPDRSEALQWMGAFFNDFMSDLERSARTLGDEPKGSAFFGTVVTASGMSSVIGPGVVRRACEMSGVDAERMSPDHLRDVLPALRKGMSIFLSNPDIERGLKRLEVLIPRVLEEDAVPESRRKN